MNLHRLELLDAVIENDFNVSRAAARVRLSQPGLSKQLQILEEELGFRLFTRAGKRLTGLTEPGREAHRIARRVLHEAAALNRIASDLREVERGSLVVATTHTQARYALPRAVAEFRREYPQVSLALHQASPVQACREVVDGRADLAIATEGVAEFPELVVLPCYEWNRSVIAPPGHPILEATKLTLREIAKHPIVTYASDFTGRSQINAAFSAQGLKPEIVISAIDSDIIKTYVALGLGVGIVATMATADDDGRRLVALDASHLFPSSTTSIGIRRGSYLRGYVLRFIELVSPHLGPLVVEKALGID